MTAPINDLIKKMADKGFVELKDGIWSPKSISRLIPLSIQDIILRYKTIYSGILNYYSFVDNRPKLRKIY
jgi:hypothetical protein